MNRSVLVFLDQAGSVLFVSETASSWDRNTGCSCQTCQVMLVSAAFNGEVEKSRCFFAKAIYLWRGKDHHRIKLRHDTKRDIFWKKKTKKKSKKKITWVEYAFCSVTAAWMFWQFSLSIQQTSKRDLNNSTFHKQNWIEHSFQSYTVVFRQFTGLWYNQVLQFVRPSVCPSVTKSVSYFLVICLAGFAIWLQLLYGWLPLSFLSLAWKKSKRPIFWNCFCCLPIFDGSNFVGNWFQLPYFGAAF